MALESAIFRQKSPHFSLFASLNTLNKFFLHKTKKQPIMSLNFNYISLFNQIGLHWPYYILLRWIEKVNTSFNML